MYMHIDIYNTYIPIIYIYIIYYVLFLLYIYIYIYIHKKNNFHVCDRCEHQYHIYFLYKYISELYSFACERTC